MDTYICKVSDKNGKMVKFIRSGGSVETIQAGLQKEGYFPVSIHPKNRKNTFTQVRFSGKTIAEFTAFMSMLLDSGLSVRDSLEILNSITQDRKIRTLVSSLEKDLKAGFSFYASIQNIGTSIPTIYGGMVKTGETTGDLSTVFRKLNAYLIRQKKIREKILSSLIYPVIVLIVAVFSMILISIFIIPKISELFAELGAGIPDELSRVIFISQALFNSFLAGIPIIFLIFFLIYLQGKKSSSFALGIDKTKLRIPFWGSFSRDRHFLNILFTLATLTTCGISIEDALKEVINTTGNIAVKEAFIRVLEQVLKGADLSVALSMEKIIPLRISKWIAIGERTGSIGKVFNQLADYYENETLKKTTRFMNLIEPALIIFTGMIVLGIVIMIIIPLFSAFGTMME